MAGLTSTAAPHDRHATAYVDNTAPSARVTARSNLRRAARAATGFDADSYPWHRASPDTLASVRASLADRYAPATANATMASVRAILKRAWIAGDLTRDRYERGLAALQAVKGDSRPGRALTPASIGKLFNACASDPNKAAGARDAVLLSLTYACGLRRAEAASATLADLDPEAGTLTVEGKGKRHRTAHPYNNGAGDALRAWLAIRGDTPGPILCRVNKGGRVSPAHGLSGVAIGKRLAKRAKEAGVGHVAPHDMRRSFATALLGAGNDLSIVAGLMGHASVSTTVRYDRRGEAAQRAAVATLAVPYTG